VSIGQVIFWWLVIVIVLVGSNLWVNDR